MSEQLRSLRHERDVREHGDAVTTRPWWNAPGEESREPQMYKGAAEYVIAGTSTSWPTRAMAYEKVAARKPIRILANPRPFT